MITADRSSAQEPAPTPTLTKPSPLNVEQLQTRLTAIQDNPDLDTALKTRLTEIYQKAIDALKTEADSTSRANQFSTQMKESPRLVETLQKQLAEPLPTLSMEFPQDATLTQVQQRQSQAEADLAEAQKRLQQWQEEPKRRADRRVEIPKLLEALRLQIEEIQRQFDVKPPSDEPVEVSTANLLLLEARKASLTAEAAALQAEARLYEISADTLPLQRDLAARRAGQLDDFVKKLRDLVNERRRREAEMQAREARRAAAQAHPALRAIADRNEELTRLRQSLAGNIEQAVDRLERIDDRTKLLDSQFAKLRKRAEMGQRNSSIGLLLRKQRDELPGVAEERRDIQSRADQIADASLKLIDFEDERNLLADLDERVDSVMDDLGAGLVPEERSLLELDVRGMLETQRGYLDSIITDTGSYLDKLVEQDIRQHELISKTVTFAQFCDERILWIRSARPLDMQELKNLPTGLQWFLSADRWSSLFRSAGHRIETESWLMVLLVSAWLVCVGLHARLRTIVVDLGDEATRGSCRDYSLTLRVFLLTIVLAVPVAGLSGIFAWVISTSVAPTNVIYTLGKGAIAVALMLGSLEWLRQVCRRRGLAEAHFNWEVRSTRRIRHGTVGIMLAALPLVFLVVSTEAQSDEAIKNSLGRVGFVLLLSVMVLPAYYATSPTAGVLATVYQHEPNAWWTRMRWAWFFFAIATPIVLIGLSVAGFHYTAVQLSEKLLLTAWLIVILIVVYCMLLRWALVAYRNLGLQRLQERRTAAAAAQSTGVPSISPAAGKNQLEIKLSDINQQTRQMLQLVLAIGLIAGVWWIWANAIPALGALRRIELWTLTTETGVGDEVKLTPITLADLMLSTIVLALTLTVSRNIPSLLELTLLKRLPLDAGARYAVSMVTRYVVYGTGFAVSFGALGLEWSQVQWLVAAVSVGLGFGLQEIFANFVSGLVLLFERPIRIGDIVTVGDVTGKVSNIRMRAATITDWDMRELIVPNKEFITGRVINWTLSTTVSRMSIYLGVAYGTDPDRVRELLLEIAAKHPLVLKDPPSHALLDEFADSTLTFVLRVHMSTRDVYLSMRHELMTQIANRFQAEGIEFAFPQRDVHLSYVNSPFDVPRTDREAHPNADPRASRSANSDAGEATAQRN